MMRVFTRALGVALGLCLAAAGAIAQTFPAKPAKPANLMLPYRAGGLSDAIARLIERPLAKNLVQQVLVDKSIKSVAFNTWTGYFVRKDTPEPVVQALHKTLSDAMGDPSTRAQLQQIGGTVPPMLSLVELTRQYEAQTARFRAITKDIKLEAQ